MPPQTRSRTHTMKTTLKEVELVKSGAARTSVNLSKSTSKAPPEKKARGNWTSPEQAAEESLVFQFASLPLELFLEIAKYLYPLDLIHLSRSNKVLRSLFMRRAAAEIWRAALANAGLPPCPDDSMSEPRYAGLIFLEQCSECCKPATHYMDPILLVRLCRACGEYMTVSAKAVGVLATVLTHSQYLVSFRGNTGARWYLLREYEEVNELVRGLKRDDDIWRDWINGRMEFVRARRERANPLLGWLAQREEAQKSRERTIENWLHLLSDRLRPTVLTLRWREPGSCPTPGPMEISCAPIYLQRVEKQDITIRIPSIPPSHDLIKHCPHLRMLLGCGKQTEGFHFGFQAKQNFLKEQYSVWRANLEAALVKALPEDLKPAKTQSSEFNLLPVSQLSDEDSPNVVGRLSVDLRVLLRADVRFKYNNGTYYYPTGFDSLMTDDYGSKYDVVSSKIAKALLHALQCPDASYLEMRALGQSFLCVRCIGDPGYYTWDDIVNHYVYQGEGWERLETSNQSYDKQGGRITIPPTHDIEAIDKPLVRLVAQHDQVSSLNNSESKCKACLGIGYHEREPITFDAYI